MVISERFLTAKEVSALTHGSRSGGPSVGEIRYWHHHMARLLAGGMNIKRIAETLGHSYSQVWALSKDPLIQELASEFLAEKEEEHQANLNAIFDLQDETLLTMAQCRNMAVTMLRDQMEDARDGRADPIHPKVLLSIQADMNDRMGLGKTQTMVHKSDMAQVLELANIRSDSVRKVIELKPLRESFLPPVEPGAVLTPSAPPPRLRRI